MSSVVGLGEIYIYRTFDTDGNGYIDFKEFLLAIDITSSGTAEEKLGWAFRWVALIIREGINGKKNVFFRALPE